MYRSHLDELVRGCFPQPIANAWSRYENARTTSDRLRYASALQETTARLLGVYLLAEWVAVVGGRPSKGADAVLGDRPSSGDRWTLIDHMCRGLSDRPEGFFAPAMHWFRSANSRPSRAYHAVERLVNLRNGDAHQIPREDPEHLERLAADQDDALLTLLQSLSWLTDYRIVRLGAATTRRVRGSDGAWLLADVGKAQAFIGDAEAPRSMAWELPRAAGGIDTASILLSHPQRGLLLLEPFAVVTGDSGRERLFLWKHVTKSGHVVAAQEMSGTEYDTGARPLPTVPELMEGVSDPTRLLVHALGGELGQPVVRPTEPHLPSGYEVVTAGIGSGAMAVVDNVVDRGGSSWALKNVHPDKNDEVAIERLRIEGRLIESLSHPNVVSGRLEYARNGRPVIRMPYIAGGTLADRIHAPFEMDEAVGWIAGLLEGLSYLHQNGVVHRDIKPQNIMVDDGGIIRIVDFGIACRPALASANRMTLVGQNVGTPGFMAPEQQLGRYAPSNDVFAAGVVLLQLLASALVRKERAVTDVPRLLSALAPAATGPMTRRLFDLASAMVERQDDGRITALDAMNRLRAPSAVIRVVDPKRDHTQRSDAYALGEAVRSVITTAARENVLAAVNEAAGGVLSADACAAASRLGEHHARSTWFVNLHRTTVMDLLDDRALRFDAARVLSAAGAAHADLGALSAGAIGLRGWLDALHPVRPCVQDEAACRARFARQARRGREDEARAAGSWSGFDGCVRRTYRVEHRRRSSGGLRRLDVPGRDLSEVQRALARILLRSVAVHPAAMAFVAGRSTVLHAAAHAGARVAVKNDLRDFFGHIRPAHIDWILPAPRMDKKVPQPARRPHPSPFDGWSADGVASVRRMLFRYDGLRRTWFLPQGAPSSPVVSNLAAVAMDEAIEDELRRALPNQPWRYTRYADDLMVSSIWPRRDFGAIVQRVVADCVSRFGWTLATEKRRVWSASSERPLVVCGVEVPSRAGLSPSLPRAERRRVRAAARRLHTRVPLEAQDSIARGTVAYAHSVSGDLRLAPLASEACRTGVRILAEALSPEDVEGFLEGWLYGRPAAREPWQDGRCVSVPSVSEDEIPF
jgi:hypothetical protein